VITLSNYYCNSLKIKSKTYINWFLKLVYIIKELVQPKMSLNREFLIWKERGRGEREKGVREREREGMGRLAGRHI
jgi:hypothetical protein